MNSQLLTVIINAVIALVGSLPQLIKYVEQWDGPEQTKEELIQRIRKAQADIAEWK